MDLACESQVYVEMFSTGKYWSNMQNSPNHLYEAYWVHVHLLMSVIHDFHSALILTLLTECHRKDVSRRHSPALYSLLDTPSPIFVKAAIFIL